MSQSLRLAVVLVALLCASPLAASATDLFGHPDSSSPGAPSGETINLVPGPLRHFLAMTISAQRTLNDALQDQMIKVKEGASWQPAFIIVLMSFLYGVVHAIGPGHGKVVVGGYLLTRRAQLVQGLAMSAAAAVTQALSALVLVVGLVGGLRLGAREILGDAEALESVSYAVIAILGLNMVRTAFRKDACCSHGGPHHHDHDHHNGHDHAAPAPAGWYSLLSTGMATGLRPCTGAVLVLLFALANGILSVGVLSTFAMAAGVMITVSLIAVTSLGAKRLMAGRQKPRSDNWRIGFSLAGALAITLFGAVQAVGLWSGLLLPTPG